MPNVTLRKSDKIDALGKLVNKKFLTKHKSLTMRRMKITQEIYDDTHGKVGNLLKESAGKNWKSWLDTVSMIEVKGLSQPMLMIPTGTTSVYRDKEKDFFTGKSLRANTVTLECSIVKPSREYNFYVDCSESNSRIRRKAATLNKDISKFNAEVEDFWNKAYCILMSIRTSRQVDEKFPELWEFLPDGTRERIKQAVVVPQEVIDDFRKEVVS